MTRTAFKYTAPLSAFVLIFSGGFQTPAYAQSATNALETVPAAPKLDGRSVVRLDLLAPLIASIDHSLNGGKGIIFPVLAAYERHLGGRWSAGAETLIRGGTPASRRSGAALFGRWYVVPINLTKTPSQGLYLSPVLSYRALRTTAGNFDRPVNTGKRAGGGLLLGWQVPPFPRMLPNLIFDGAVGVIAWTRLGEDRTSAPGYYAQIGEPIFKRTGFLPDVRYGLGYRF